jgi:hypothetical protein
VTAALLDSHMAIPSVSILYLANNTAVCNVVR